MADDFMNDADAAGTQEPERPTKKKKEGMSLPLMIGIGIGVVVINVVLIVVLIKFVMPNFTGDGKNEKGKNGEIKGKNVKPKDEFAEEESEFLDAEKEKKYIDIPKISTNPKMSSKFVQVSLSIEFRPKPGVKEEEIGPENSAMKSLQSKIKAIVIKEIGNMTIEELQAGRGELDKRFREKLKAVFMEQKLFLRNVYITDFLLA